MDQSVQNFLYPLVRYRGQVQPKHLVFNSNLQEFAQRVSYICNLQTGGKLSPEAAFEQIEQFWNQLQQSKTQLNIDTSQGAEWK